MPPVTRRANSKLLCVQEDFANYEVNDPFVQQLLSAIETTLAEVKVHHSFSPVMKWLQLLCLICLQGRLLPAVFGHVFSELTTELTVLLEQQIFSCAFDQVASLTAAACSITCPPPLPSAGGRAAGQGPAGPHGLPLLPHQLARQRQVLPPHADCHSAQPGDGGLTACTWCRLCCVTVPCPVQVNELFDYWGGSMMWRLTPSEIRRVLHLRRVVRGGL